MFAAPIPISVGETVEREGFVYTDLVPVATAAVDPQTNQTQETVCKDHGSLC